MPWAKIIPAGVAVYHFGGRIGLSGAEFRLPLLIGLFGFAALEAVILNKATSLIVVATALPFRLAAFPPEDVFAPWPIIVNLLAGSLLGAWRGAGWAVRMTSLTAYDILVRTAEWINTGNYVPPSIVSTTKRAALVAAGLLTKATLHARQIY